VSAWKGGKATQQEENYFCSDRNVLPHGKELHCPLLLSDLLFQHIHHCSNSLKLKRDGRTAFEL